MSTIESRLQTVREQMAQMSADSGRLAHPPALLAVSKTFGASAVAQAHAAGQRAFGENYIQEAVDKIAACRALGLADLQWHFIGSLQTNKTRLVAEHFDWMHTLDRLKIAQRLSEQRPTGRAPLQVCVQVNVDASATKAGVSEDQAVGICAQIASLPNLCLRGLMALPDPVLLGETGAVDGPATLALHARVVQLHAHVLAQLPAGSRSMFDTVSLGMSGDMAQAIAAGSTIVRVGSAIFGHRAPRP